MSQWGLYTPPNPTIRNLVRRCRRICPATAACCMPPTAMMAAGWDGAPAGKPAPGFPDDGNWVVKWEGLKKAP